MIDELLANIFLIPKRRFILSKIYHGLAMNDKY